MRLTAAEKRNAATRLLEWLKETGTTNWPNTYEMIQKASSALDEEIYTLWKAFDLLIVLGRLERNSPSGQKGARVEHWTPIEAPAPAHVVECKPENCPVLETLKKRFPSVREALETP